MASPFKIKNGATFKVEIILTDVPTETFPAGEPLDLVGYTLISEVRQEVVADKRSLTLVDPLTVTVLDEPGGVIRLSATPAETEDWPEGRLIFDVRLESSTGDVIFTDNYAIDVAWKVTGHA